MALVFWESLKFVLSLSSVDDVDGAFVLRNGQNIVPHGMMHGLQRFRRGARNVR